MIMEDNYEDQVDYQEVKVANSFNTTALAVTFNSEIGSCSCYWNRQLALILGKAATRILNILAE